MEDRPVSKRRSRSWSEQHNGMDNGAHASSKEHEAEGAIEDADSHSISDLEMEAMGSDEDEEDDGEETGMTNSKHSSRKQRRRRQLSNGEPGSENTAGVSGGPSSGKPPEATQEEKEKQVNSTMLRQTIINVLLIALWYSFSISISVYNKWMFSKDNLNFPFPLFTTSIHMIVQFSLSCLVLFFLPQFRPGADVKLDNKAEYTQLNNSTEEEAQAQELAGEDAPEPVRQQPLMTKAFYFSRIAPCGTATALDIGLGNFSLRFISLTFFTMCKSSVLAFVLLFAFLFGLESPTLRLCAIILLMTVGVIMMVAGEAAFNAAGFLLVMSASLCSGFRWSLTQILLLRNRATSNPFSATFFLTPVMFLALFLLALPVEGPASVIAGIKDLSNSEGGFLSILILLFPGFLAFLMVSAEFALLKRTSVVTLSVCGIFKEVLTISAAGVIFGDELTPINVSGLFVTIASIAAYNWLKYSKMRVETEEKVQESLDQGAGGSAAGAAGSVEGVDKGLDDAREVPSAAAARRESEPRGSTDALMRDSLSLSISMNHAQNGKAMEVSLSPIKRPEDLE